MLHIVFQYVYIHGTIRDYENSFLKQKKEEMTRQRTKIGCNKNEKR